MLNANLGATPASLDSLVRHIIVFPSVMYGLLYCRQLEREKTLALRYSKGVYNACMVVSDKAGTELSWWNTHLKASYNVISHGEPTGDMSTVSNILPKEIWLWFAQKNIWLTPVHIPGVENVEANRQSRWSHSQLEWTLYRNIFRDYINAAKV